jgi:integrase
VRVHQDGRVVYWTGGRPGLGDRLFERCDSAAHALERAVEIRAQLLLGSGTAVSTGSSLDQVMCAMRDHMTARERPAGTVNQYRSNWNCWVPPAVRATPCSAAQLQHWSAVFDHIVATGGSKATVRAVARTLGSVITFGVERGFFLQAHPFGPPLQRKAVVSRATRDARPPTSRRYTGVAIAEDIDAYARAFETLYPGYGFRLVHLALATGLRIQELLALRSDRIDLETGIVEVLEQLDLSRPWPATKLPKGEKTRTSIVWGSYLHIAETLVQDSQSRQVDRSWLFPRHNSMRGWGAKANRLASLAAKNSGVGWTHHWLRHTFASVSAAPPPEGFGFALASVAFWMGHEDSGITVANYVERGQDAVVDATRRSRHVPTLLESPTEACTAGKEAQLFSVEVHPNVRHGTGPSAMTPTAPPAQVTP